MMGRRHLRWLLLGALLISLCPSAAAALPPCAYWDGDDLHLRGRVGTAAVSVYLDAGWPSQQGADGVSGLVLDHRKWERRQEATWPLDGRLLTDCRLQLTESGSAEGDGWTLRILSPTRAQGTRLIGGRSEALSFTIGRPFDCTAGRWRNFVHRNWPVTFDYPASSRVTAAGSEVTIECPDVSRLASGSGAMTLEHVWRVDAEGVGGRTGTRLGPFVSFANDTWLVGDDEDCRQRPEDIRSFRCERAAARDWRGFTVLQGPAPGEDRRYRPGGGYVGQGGGITYYAFLLGDEAIVVASDELPDDVSALDSPARGERSWAVAVARIVSSLMRR